MRITDNSTEHVNGVKISPIGTAHYYIRIFYLSANVPFFPLSLTRLSQTCLSLCTMFSDLSL
jgi:hypothetical protein